MKQLRLYLLIGLMIPPGFALFRTGELPFLQLSVFGCALAGLLFFLSALLCARERAGGTPSRGRSVAPRALDVAVLGLGLWAGARASDLPGVGDALRILGIGGILIAMRSMTLSYTQLRLVLRLGTAIGAGLTFVSVALPFTRVDVNGITTGSMLGVFAFYPFALAVVTRSRSERVVSLLTFLLLALSLLQFRSRASVVAILLATFVGAFLIHFRPGRRKLAAISLASAFCFVAPVCYMVVGNAHVVEDAISGVRVREEVRLGKRVNTGRERLWPRVAVAIRDRPWIGFGTRQGGFAQTGFHLSSHNSFLHAWLEWGLVGLCLLVLFFVTVLLQLSGRGSTLASCSLAFFLACLCRDSFEVALVQNNSPLALASWTIIGLGLVRLRGEGGVTPGMRSRSASEMPRSGVGAAAP